MRRLDKVLCFYPKGIYSQGIGVDVEEKLTRTGILLKSLRVKENLTPQAFAGKIRVTIHELSAMENGQRLIGIEIARRIERAFGMDYRYFIE